MSDREGAGKEEKRRERGNYSWVGASWQHICDICVILA